MVSAPMRMARRVSIAVLRKVGAVSIVVQAVHPFPDTPTGYLVHGFDRTHGLPAFQIITDCP